MAHEMHCSHGSSNTLWDPPFKTKNHLIEGVFSLNLNSLYYSTYVYAIAFEFVACEVSGTSGPPSLFPAGIKEFYIVF